MRIVYLIFLPLFLFSQTILNETFSKFVMPSTTSSWVFDTAWQTTENSGGNVYTDLVGSNNLTAYGSPTTFTGISPIYSGGTAYHSDNTDDHYYIAGASAGGTNLGTGSWTLAIWLNIYQDPAANVYIVSKRGSGAYYNLRQVGSTDEGAIDTHDGSNTKSEGIPALSFNVWYYLVAVMDRSNNILTTYRNGVQTATPVDITGFGNLDNSNNFAISVYSGSAGTNASYPFEIAQVVLDKTAWNLQNVKENGYLGDGWKSYSGNVTRPNNTDFCQGIVGDTIYYNTSLATGTWTISVSDSAASAITYNVLTSSDATNWTQIGTDATSTTWQTSEFSGTGQGYFAIAVPTGTAYFDNVIVTNTPNSQDKGFKEYPKFPKFKGLK